jgi:hypothetical protein
MFGAGMHPDPQMSTRKGKVVRWGHNSVVLAVIARLPFCPDRVFSLPILFRVYLNHTASKRWRRVHRTRPELARRVAPALLVHGTPTAPLPRRRGLGLRRRSRTRAPAEQLRSDQPLAHERTLVRCTCAAQVRRAGASAQARRTLPALQQMLRQQGRRHELKLYGYKQRSRIVETETRWDNVPDRRLKAVAVEPLGGGRPMQSLYPTCVEDTAEQAMIRYSCRWTMEESFQGGKSHLGFQEP